MHYISVPVVASSFALSHQSLKMKSHHSQFSNQAIALFSKIYNVTLCNRQHAAQPAQPALPAALACCVSVLTVD